MNRDLVKIMGNLAEEAYTTYNEKDSIKDLPYTVLDSIDTSSGFQGYLLQNDSPAEGKPKYVFAFRGTEADTLTDWITLEAIKDLFITDFAYMGTGTAPQQMKDAMAFIKKMIDDPNLDLTADNTVCTGHSLGGSLAGMASYIYGFDAYTYNGFGIKNMLWDAKDTSAVDHPNELVSIQGDTYDNYQTLGEYLD